MAEGSDLTPQLMDYAQGYGWQRYVTLRSPRLFQRSDEPATEVCLIDGVQLPFGPGCERVGSGAQTCPGSHPCRHDPDHL